MCWCYQTLNSRVIHFNNKIVTTLFTSTWILTCAEGIVNNTLFKQINWVIGWITCNYLYICDEILHDFQWKYLWLLFLICLLIVYSEAMCPSMIDADLVNYPSIWYSTWRIPQTLTPDDNFKKVIQKVFLTGWQFIGIFTNLFSLNRENVVKMSSIDGGCLLLVRTR